MCDLSKFMYHDSQKYSLRQTNVVAQLIQYSLTEDSLQLRSVSVHYFDVRLHVVIL